jgi:bifunctional non-homologous end joining protein LigD
MFSAAALRPMLASLPPSPPPLQGKDLLYEPKYDGIRAITLVEPAETKTRVRFWSRLGNEKTAQFPELVAALGDWGAAFKVPVVLDGEIVALDAAGKPAGFQRLQGRIHVSVPGYRSSKPIVDAEEQPTAFIAFDLLRHGDEDLRALPLVERRARLEALFTKHKPPHTSIRLSEQVVGNGERLYERARQEGWEGLLVKSARSPYRDGRRSPEWRKLKITNDDEFVVGGWTEPKGARDYFGALVLGAYDDAGRLVHAGDVGTGFSGAELVRLWKVLKPLETDSSPFHTRPKTLGRPHWAKPTLVVQVRFTEWTDDGRLRHPTYLGLRDDKRPQDVKTTRPAGKATPKSPRSALDAPDKRRAGPSKSRERTASPASSKRFSSTRAAAANPLKAWAASADAMTAQLDDLEQRKRDGKLQLPDGDTLDVSNLQKVFWPEPKYTKGDLIRYYARLAPLILPVIEDRALVMKRFPNGVKGEAFYQHRAPDIYPRGVRVEVVEGADVPTMFVGGSLKTLLYMAQLAAISMDPWFSKADEVEHPDMVAIDLDPQPGATFAQILDVARWVKEELDRLHVPAFPKTSGSEGLHVFIPLAPATSYETGVLLCQIVATLVASKHPKVATIERMVKRRKDRTIYVDYLQNIPGKTLACAYSARASGFAGVSAPLKWEELDDDIAPQDFTIKTMEKRVSEVGDLWAALRKSKPANLEKVLEKLAK